MISLRRRDWFGVAGFEPGAERLARGGLLYMLDEVGSTSDFLLCRGEPADGRICRWDGWGWQAGERQSLPPPREPRPGSVVVARRQTAGRGRMGRRWRSGGLMMSWLLDPLPAPQASRLAVWTGLMTVLAVREYFGEPVMLKWPNDLRLHGRKLGGIILDMIMQGGRSRLVAGLGVNLGELPTDMPDDLRKVATALPPRPGGRGATSRLAGAILKRWDAQLPRFLEAGWDAFADDYTAVDDLAGREIELVRGDERLRGTASGIDGEGALLLRDDDRTTQRLLAGDVHVTGLSGSEAGEADDAAG